MSYVQRVTEDIRLAVLQLLESAGGYEYNEHVLRAALSDLGRKVSSDRLRTELAWLGEQGLVRVTDVTDTVRVARLTERGADVALGVALAPGVARPRPGV
jgi:Fe2+ or Zn2+ uptake regulation protein